MKFDTSDWTRVVELPHGALFTIRPGIVAAIPDQGVVETVELSKTVYAGYETCAEEAGHPIAVVVLVDHLGNQTPEVRRYWQGVMNDTSVLCGAALVSSSFFARAISSFFIGIKPPVVPTRMFANLDAALAWSSARLAEVVG